MTPRTARGLAAGALSALVGCHATTTDAHYAGLRDGAWPYSSYLLSRDAVLDPFRQQAANGAVLNATLFNYHFRPETLRHAG